jgi:RNA polymerase sigma factor (sigma-70 family)
MRDCTTTSSARHRPDITQALVEHDGLVHWVVQRQWLGELPYAEALHQGRIGLWRALRGYDPRRGCAFSTYAVPAIQRAVWHAVEQARPNPREVLTPHPPRSAPDLDEVAQQALVRQALYRLVARLPQPLRYVIVTHYGLVEGEPRTCAAIGRTLGLTHQRVSQLHVEALLWLAHPAHSLTLRQRLGCNSVADYRAYLARLRAWQRARRRRR